MARKLDRFPSSPTKISVRMTFATFMTGLSTTLLLGPLFCLVPIIGWVGGPIVIIMGIVGMLGCWKSREAECPHCGGEVDLIYPWFNMKGMKCQTCKHQLTFSEGNIYDVSAISTPVVKPSSALDNR